MRDVNIIGLPEVHLVVRELHGPQLVSSHLLEN